MYQPYYDQVRIAWWDKPGLTQGASNNQVKGGTTEYNYHMSPVNADWHPSAVKAQCLINSAGVIQGSLGFGVSSVSKAGTGLYTFNLSRAMADTNYSVHAQLESFSCTNSTMVLNRTTTSFQVRVQGTCDSGFFNSDIGLCVSVTGRLA